MRGFRCVPLSLIRARALNDLTSFVRDVMWSALLAQDERHCLPFETCELRSAIFPNRPFVGLSQIAAARDKLVALGVWLHKTTPRKEWLEIHPDYRHSEGQNETSYGEEPRAVQQGQLPFPPAVVPLRAQKINGLRAESDSEEIRDPDSREPVAGGAATTPASSAVVPTEPPGRNRALGKGQESKPCFARTVVELGSTPLGRRVHDYIGQPQIAEEMRQSGAEWLRILAEEAVALHDILETLERSRHLVKTGKFRAQTLTAKLGTWRNCA